MERVLGMRLEHRPESVGSFASNLRGFEQVRDFIASSTVTALIDLPFALLFVRRHGCGSRRGWRSCRWWSPSASSWSSATSLQHRLHELSETTYRPARSATPRWSRA